MLYLHHFDLLPSAMFSQACVKNSVHRHPPAQCMLEYTPPAHWQTSPPRQTLPPVDTLPPRQTPPRQTPHPAPAATAAEGTHPTGMHFCWSCKFIFFSTKWHGHLGFKIYFLATKFLQLWYKQIFWHLELHDLKNSPARPPCHHKYVADFPAGSKPNLVSFYLHFPQKLVADPGFWLRGCKSPILFWKKSMKL